MDETKGGDGRPRDIRCRLGLHTAVPSRLWNDGHYFSACQRCGTAMIRTATERWHTVPPHLRVVWRPRTADDIDWPADTF